MATKRALTIYEETKKTLQLRDMFSLKEAILCEEVLEAYWNARTGSKRYQVESVKSEINTIMRVTTFLGKLFWRWTAADLDLYFSDLAHVQKLAHSTQLSYYHHIATLFEFVVNRPYIYEEIRLRANAVVTQLCTDMNTLVHAYNKSEKKIRPAFTHDEILIMFDSMDAEAIRAENTHSKNFYPILRDKTICTLLYFCGLRINEALTLTLSAFEPNPAHPEFGRWGMMTVLGKGSKGLGPKPRPVPILDKIVVNTLEWYMREVRPFYVRKCLYSQLFFMSERGKKLGKSCFEERFSNHVSKAGLAYQNFTPHSMRHTSVTHEYHRLSAEANRIKHGHVFGSTTQGYMHISDDYIQKEFNEAISLQLDSL
jgi:site-specific recombinase XerD